MSANSAMVFRVLQIPPDATIVTLGDVLATQFSAESISLNTRKCTILPSCYSNGTQTALVQFVPNPPLALLALTNGRFYDMEFGDSGSAIYIDNHFYDLTQLYAVKGEIDADIVAVSGLDSHPYGSWRGRSNMRPMWLRHYFSQEFPRCRTMIYGYESKLTAPSVHTTEDFAKQFLQELYKARPSDDEKKRPIVFIGHSFGGLIVARALVEASESGGLYGDLFNCARATIFLSTPHRGVQVDDILAMVGKDSPRADLLNSIIPGSDGLKTQLAKFIDCSASLKIISFYETAQTQKLAKGPDGRWRRSGAYFTCVKESSSVLQHPNGHETVLPAEGDHCTMVKFGFKQHLTYTSVVKFVRDLALATPLPVHAIVTPYQAVITGDVSSLVRILHSPAMRVDVNKRCALDTTTMLHIAVTNRDKRMIGLLLESGADTEIVNHLGFTVLHSAIRAGDEDIVRILLEHGSAIGATISTERISALHLAALVGNPKVLALLLESRVDIEATTSNNCSALHFAAWCGHADVTAMLLKNGANHTVRAEEGLTALHFASTGAVVEILLSSGALTEVRSSGGATALHVAVLCGREDVVVVLLKNGADVKAKSKTGLTALHLCRTRVALHQATGEVQEVV